MIELSPSQVTITDEYWRPRLLVNANKAIFHQWEQLEQSHTIDNFRLVTGEKQGFREGWFFADSDAYKWLEAAARIYSAEPDDKLKHLMDDLISLLARAQAEDGYLFTYNQIFFPKSPRWQNTLIEHEFYCHGHLIEACVSHFQSTGETSALQLARRAADMLVSEFLDAGSNKTSGHEEIELALLRLYQITGRGTYLELARQFIERRGHLHPFSLLVFLQNGNVNKRSQYVATLRKNFMVEHPEMASFQLSPNNFAKTPRLAKVRWQVSALNGKYFQMHKPIRRQIVPVGHAVRFGYLETAIAMLYRQDHDATLLPALEKAWERLVTRRMYVTGGIGSLPESEGFGRDYELDPEIAYAETCAALGCMFWNWEMSLITANARYSDLFEWQLYNAASVGMGLGGDAYLYNNPLLCRGGIIRRPWFQVPCCPSNLSRTWASLGKYIFSTQDDNLWVHQYISCQAEVNPGLPVMLDMKSSLPWEGKIDLSLDMDKEAEFTLWLRIPSWAKDYVLEVNGSPWEYSIQSGEIRLEMPASGYDPRTAIFLPINRRWKPGDVVSLKLDLPIQLRHASHRLRSHKDKVALTRGPLVYCLESVDNPGIDLFTARLDPSSLHTEISPALLGGTQIILGKTIEGQALTFIPYHLWANRGESQMTVWMFC